MVWHLWTFGCFFPFCLHAGVFRVQPGWVSESARVHRHGAAHGPRRNARAAARAREVDPAQEAALRGGGHDAADGGGGLKTDNSRFGQVGTPPKPVWWA